MTTSTETTTTTTTTTDVLIIGAGIAGLTAGKALQPAGLSVQLVDKGRGVGGRLSTRRFANGAWFDHGWLDRSVANRDEILEALERCDSNTVLSATGHVLLTGPTHTNVCDLRVALRSS